MKKVLRPRTEGVHIGGKKTNFKKKAPRRRVKMLRRRRRQSTQIS